MSNDIRKGDLVRGTHKARPEEVLQGRVESEPSNWWVYTRTASISRSDFDIEVLDRPIEKELLDGAVAAGGKPFGFKPGDEGATFRGSIQAVIEFVRAYDKEHAR